MATTKHVVVGVDGSATSDAAVRWAADTAQRRGLPLLVVSSYEIPQFLYAEGVIPSEELLGELRTTAEGWVADASRRAAECAPGLAVEQRIVESNPVDSLLKISQGQELVVLGSRGLGGLSGMVLGSVSASVVSHAKCPVTVVREDMAPPAAGSAAGGSAGSIVVGVDGSEVSSNAIDFAFREASSRGVGVTAVHAWVDRSIHAAMAGVRISDDQLQRVKEVKERTVSEALAGYSECYPDVPVERVIVQDRPVRALADAATDALMVVVGSHGRGGFAGMLLGSTSRALLQAAPCPVTVIR